MDKVSSESSSGPSPIGGVRAIAVGFSARALVQALKEAGFRVIALDAFGDHDTCESTKEHRILANWGAKGIRLEAVFRELADFSSSGNSGLMPVFLAAGETWPSLIESLLKVPQFHLLGPTPAQIAAIRTLDSWVIACSQTELRLPPTVQRGPSGTQNQESHGDTAIAPPNEGLATNTQQHSNEQRLNGSETNNCLQELTWLMGGKSHCRQLLQPSDLSAVLSAGQQWLSKSLASAGGLGVHRFPTDNAAQGRLPSAHLLQDPHGYLQQFVEGQVFGAALNVRWAGNDDGPEIEMLGTTAAWSSAQWPAAGEFTYRGGYGPIELSPSDQDAILSFAKHLCQRCPGQYKGWLQVDFIRSNEGHLYLLEVNPRWTSSMEILVRSQLVNPCIQHAAAWGLDIDPQAQRKRSAIALFGKAIVYASSDLVLTQNYLQHLHHLPRQHYADLPSNNYKGQVIPSGHPLLTVIDSVPLGTNAPAESLLKQLRNLASRVL